MENKKIITQNELKGENMQTKNRKSIRKIIIMIFTSFLMMILLNSCLTDLGKSCSFTIRGYTGVGYNTVLLSDVSIRLMHTESGKTHSGTTNSNGFKKITGLSAGSYDLTLSRSGYRTYTGTLYISSWNDSHTFTHTMSRN